MTQERAAHAALPRTWIPFFGRFGRLTDVQVKAIPEILAGRNLVVISPAASGKTEAVAAPIVERTQPNRGKGLAVLYVSPTRALVNDLYRRLAEPLEYLGLGLERKTGDHPEISESRLPFMLITTPESFDSLLCRHTVIFRELKAVILDELHLLDNTPRGDQLRVLLNRLRLVNPRVQYCALSATIDDQEIGSRYFSDAQVVKVESQRSIEQLLLPLDEDWVGRAVGELRQRDCRKVLCFFNARSAAESAARELEVPPFRGRVWVHHASLNRKLREEVEAAMNRERTGLLCCTSTLELGIDIGDIDAVLLVRPPFNVSSLLQRIGRGNRRRASGLFAVGLYQDQWERFLFEALLDCARVGKLYEKHYTPSLAVLPQQIASYAFQRRRIGTTLKAVQSVMAPVFGPAVDKVFLHLVTSGHLDSRRPGVYFVSPKLERQVEYGKIHSNIQDKSFGRYEVCDYTSGRHLGTVFFVFRRFMLGGRAWELVELREKEKRAMVRPLDEAGAVTEVFEGTGTGGYGYRMAKVLRGRLFPRLTEDGFPCFEDAGRIYIVHLLGTTYGFVLAQALTLEGSDAFDLDGKLLGLPADRVRLGKNAFPLPQESSFRAVVEENLRRFEDCLGSGAFWSMLPGELQVEDHMLALDIAGLRELLGRAELVRLEGNEVRTLMAAALGSGTPSDSTTVGQSNPNDKAQVSRQVPVTKSK